ncbi:hypothetical protein M752DRAFT_339754 [Aspergillus phoenicis ATCC 13157]|uniref:Uncharacterized protein n=1 Tax=Aspergillus phoenicis ATCC 13157 TaxID=1353007 RepID=A0A370P6I4_ASPPH|nr:hypothetical protein M752DRAFT_339754 [Aspergillus phoenicis ATCC 13157]
MVRNGRAMETLKKRWSWLIDIHDPSAVTQKPPFQKDDLLPELHLLLTKMSCKTMLVGGKKRSKSRARASVGASVGGLAGQREDSSDSQPQQQQQQSPMGFWIFWGSPAKVLATVQYKL